MKYLNTILTTSAIALSVASCSDIKDPLCVAEGKFTGEIDCYAGHNQDNVAGNIYQFELSPASVRCFESTTKKLDSLTVEQFLGAEKCTYVQEKMENLPDESWLRTIGNYDYYPEDIFWAETVEEMK